MTYFHFAPIRLRKGSIIEPGNFGRMLKRYGTNDANWLLARELIFEGIRAEKFADKPSRFSACFGLPTKEDADKYRAANDQNFLQVLHTVEPVDSGLPLHKAFLSLTAAPGHPFLDRMRMNAVSYWSAETGDAAQGEEIVTSSAWRVIECLE